MRQTLPTSLAELSPEFDKKGVECRAFAWRPPGVFKCRHNLATANAQRPWLASLHDTGHTNGRMTGRFEDELELLAWSELRRRLDCEGIRADVSEPNYRA
jgi:hypothetical protein